MSKTKEGKLLQDRMTEALKPILDEQLGGALSAEQRQGNIGRVVRALFRTAARVAFTHKALLPPPIWGAGAIEMMQEELEPETTAHQEAAKIAVADFNKKMLN